MKRTPLKRKTWMRRVSHKQKKRNAEFEKVKAEWLSKNPFCEIDAPNFQCTLSRNVTVHHIRQRYGDYLCNTKYFATACSNCHHYIHFVDPKWARENGFLK